MEKIIDLIVGGEEALRLAGLFEALHLPLASARGLMRVLRPVIETLVLPVLNAGYDLLLRGPIAGQLVSDQDPWWGHYRFSSFQSKRLAARLSRRLCTRMSVSDRAPKKRRILW